MIRKPPTETTYSLDELEGLTGMRRRTIRYYIQIGLLGKAEGATKAARYSQRHLEQLQQINNWTQQGLNLDRIRQLLTGEVSPGTPPAGRAPGIVEVRSHIVVAEGIEVAVDPARAGLGPEALRKFVKLVANAYQAAKEGNEDDDRARGTANARRRNNDS